MTRRIIRPLSRVDETGMILWDQILEVAVQIGPCRGIGILIDDEAGARVSDKDRGESRADPLARRSDST